MGDSCETLIYNNGECDTSHNLCMTKPVNNTYEQCISKEPQTYKVGDKCNTRKRRLGSKDNLSAEVKKKSPALKEVVHSAFRNTLVVRGHASRENDAMNHENIDKVSSIINPSSPFCREKVWLPVNEYDCTDGEALGIVLKPGEVMVKTNAHINEVYIEIDAGFLCCCEGEIVVKPIRMEDPSFRFQMLTYDYQVMKKDGNWQTEEKKRARIFRHYSDDKHCRFVYINDSGTVSLKEKQDSMCSTPGVNDINSKKCWGGFQVSSSVLLSYNLADKGPEKLILESLSKRHCYVLGDCTKKTLTLAHEDEELSLMYKSNATFKIHNLDS